MSEMGQLGMHFFSGSLSGKNVFVPPLPRSEQYDEASILIYVLCLAFFMFIITVTSMGYDKSDYKMTSKSHRNHLTGDY